MSGPDGLVVVDKPGGMTSHDVVARARRALGTRKVGHAGTLDPMATGVLVLGVGRGTRLLGHLVLTTKAYAATIRLGQATTTDDAEGEPLGPATPTTDVDDAAVAAGIAGLTGDISQVPSAVSAIKIDGQRAYKRVRAGEDVVIAARPVTVSRFELLATRRSDDGSVTDLDVVVECSSGTYVRALARDLGAGLGVGGHLVALRRTRVGPYGLDVARTLDDLADDPTTLSLETAAGMAFVRRDLDAAEATDLGHGRPLSSSAAAGVGPDDGPVAAYAPDGTLVALLRDDPSTGRARPLVVLAPAGRDGASG